MTQGISKDLINQNSNLSWDDYQSLDLNSDDVISAQEIDEVIKGDADLNQALLYVQLGGDFSFSRLHEHEGLCVWLVYDLFKEASDDSDTDDFANAALALSRELYRNPDLRNSYYALKQIEAFSNDNILVLHAQVTIDSEERDYAHREYHAMLNAINARHGFKPGDPSYRVCHPDVEINILKEQTVEQRVSVLKKAGKTQQATDIQARAWAASAMYGYRRDPQDNSLP